MEIVLPHSRNETRITIPLQSEPYQFQAFQLTVQVVVQVGIGLSSQVVENLQPFSMIMATSLLMVVQQGFIQTMALKTEGMKFGADRGTALCPGPLLLAWHGAMVQTHTDFPRFSLLQDQCPGGCRRNRQGYNPETCQCSVAVKDVTDADFAAAVLRADLPVLVDFWAPWCGPCRLVAPLMDWAVGAYGDRLLVMKMEVDPNPVTRDQYRVQGIPSLLVFRGGEVIGRHEGALSQKQLRTFLDAHL